MTDKPTNVERDARRAEPQAMTGKWALPLNVRKRLRVSLLLLLAASCAAAAAVAPPGTPGRESKVTDIGVVFKTHYDIGDTDLVTNVLRRYRVEMMDKALGIMEANP